MTEREVSSERVIGERLERILDNARHEFLAADTQVMCQYWQDRIDIYTELLALRSSVKTVGVKKLEWKGVGEDAYAEGGGFCYTVRPPSRTPGWRVWVDVSAPVGMSSIGGAIVTVKAESRDAAIAAAQADYERRILSAIEAPVAPSEVTDEMVERLAREIASDEHNLSGDAKAVRDSVTNGVWRDYERRARRYLTAALKGDRP